MADLKTVLTETLAAHLTIDGFAILACNVCNMRYDNPTAWATHATEVIAGLSGVAVTQLPEGETR